MSDEKVTFLIHFKTVPWQIIESLQICYDNGDEIIKTAALKAAKIMDDHLKKMESIWIEQARERNEIIK